MRQRRVNSRAIVVRPSQGLDDHAHVPTLQLLPKSLPVIASPTAAEVATKLGFTQVVSLAPGKTWIQGAPYLHWCSYAPAV